MYKNSAAKQMLSRYLTLQTTFGSIFDKKNARNQYVAPTGLLYSFEFFSNNMRPHRGRILVKEIRIV